MKTCTACGIAKSLDCFSTNGRCGIHPTCKRCQADGAKARRLADPEKFREADRIKYLKNKEKKLAANARWVEQNKDKRKAAVRQNYVLNAEIIKKKNAAYRLANPDKIREWNGTKRAILRMAMPKWVDRKAIASFYREASSKWQETGIPHHVDHIIPLKGNGVSGLHVPWNLQVLTYIENLRKGNSVG